MLELSFVERWILANQYRILERVDPKEADSHARARKILEAGYEYQYGWISEHIYRDDDILTRGEAQEVHDVLQMYEILRLSFERSADKGGLEPKDVEFPGFDGNEETKQLAYTRFFCVENSPPRYTNLPLRNDDFNSHLPTLRRYRAMLPVFKSLYVPSKALDGELLTVDQINEVLQAGLARRLDAGS